MSVPRISVIIPAYSSGRMLRETLEGLAAQEGAFEVVVVDDGSTDGTADMVEGLPFPVPLRVERQQHRGRAAARNVGAERAVAPVLLFLDADVRPTPGFIAAHLRHYRDGERRGVQGRTLQDPRTLTTLFMQTSHMMPDLTVRRQQNLSPYHVITRNFSVSAAAFRDVGGFDEEFVGYGWEDIELGLRLKQAGVRLHYDPEALAYHLDLQQLEDAMAKLRQAGEGAVYFWRKHGRSPSLGLFLEIHPLLLPLKWLIFRTGVVTRIIETIRPWAERRRLLLLCNECYNHLLWRSFYEGVYAALRTPERREHASEGATHGSSPAERQ